MNRRTSLAPILLLPAILAVVPSCREEAASTSAAGAGVFPPDAYSSGTADAGEDVEDEQGLDIGEDADVPPGAAEGEACSILNGGCQPQLKCIIDQERRGICVRAGSRVEGETCGEHGDDDCAGVECAELGDGCPGLVCFDPRDAPERPGLHCYRFCNALRPSEGCAEGWVCCERLLWSIEAIGVCRPVEECS